MSEPAYTPRPEYQCDGSTTHYQGCKCHEARWQASWAEAKAQADHRWDMMESYSKELVETRAENARLRAALEWIAKGPTFGPGAPTGMEQAQMQSRRAKEALGSGS